MKNSVKTEKRAIEILTNWLRTNVVSETQGSETKKCVMECECGETSGISATVFDMETRTYDNVAFVAICPECGNDDAFDDDVIDER